MIQIKLVLIFSFSLLRRQIATAAQEQPSSIVTWTNMGWQHDAILGPYRTSGFWMPKWVSWPFWSISNVGCLYGLCATLVGTTCGPYGLPVWGPNGSIVGLRWVSCAWLVWTHCGPWPILSGSHVGGPKGSLWAHTGHQVSGCRNGSLSNFGSISNVGCLYGLCATIVGTTCGPYGLPV